MPTVLETPEAERTERAESESFRELLGRLASGSAALVRDEIDLAKQEITEKVKSLSGAAIAIAVGAAFAFVGFLALIAALIAGISVFLSAWLSALIVGVALMIVAAIVAFSGFRLMKKTSLKPEKTISSLKEDREWLRNLTT
jgi:uncharacterized membrane protein YqjE